MASDSENETHSPTHSADESESDSDNGELTEDHEMESKTSDSKSGTGQKKPNKGKDPSRPRRKKARRACYACQRAHLTCGDERPCQRCVKRGLSDSCQDGVRKKAKYLHDAPAEALIPGNAHRYQYISDIGGLSTQQNASFAVPSGSGAGDAFSPRQAGPNIPNYGPSPTVPAAGMNDSILSPSYLNPQSPLAHQMPGNSGLSSASLQGLGQALPQQLAGDGSTGMSGAGFDGNFFDPSELAQYDFDPRSFNFGNHYGALEFGMLGHMSSGAQVGSPTGELGNPLGQGLHAFTTPNTISTGNYGESPIDGTNSFVFVQDPAGGLGDWRPAQQQSNVRQGGASMSGGSGSEHRGSRENGYYEPRVPRAFSVGIGPNGASPQPTQSPEQYEDGSGSSSRAQFLASSSSPRGAHRQHEGSRNGNNQGRAPPQTNLGVNATQALAPKRKRGNPSAIYTNVTQPYSYITGFHSLILLLERRFSQDKVVRIAKALSSIRPSFMSCTRTLGRDDLVFMEKCFQRTLWEYEDFINACGTPTIVCRRTGEVAAAGKEFSILTKWRRDVLLGREANLNINTGEERHGELASSAADVAAGGQSMSGGGAVSATRGGASTPRIPEHMIDNSRPHPVSLAELLDGDSVVAFYEDFARLAFGDSKGVVSTQYKLLKYRTKENEHDDALQLQAQGQGGEPGESRSSNRAGKRATGTGRPDAGTHDLGQDGKIECACCWTVKRDIFDLPMMIIMNFLPCI